MSGNEPSSVALFNRQRKPEYCAAVSRKYTGSLNQRHIPKCGQIIEQVLRIVFLNVSILNTLNTDLKTLKEKYNLHNG